MQAPGRPFTPTAESERELPRIVLVRNGATVSSEDGIMMGSGNDPLTTLGEIQAQKTGEVLMDLKVAAPSEYRSPARGRLGLQLSLPGSSICEESLKHSQSASQHRLLELCVSL